MILADTSIWIDHFRQSNPRLRSLLEDAQVLIHPFILGELAVCNLRQRQQVIGFLKALPMIDVATHAEILGFVETQNLFGIGIGYIDVHLLGSVKLSQGTMLWTLDKRLEAAAIRLGLSQQTH